MSIFSYERRIRNTKSGFTLAEILLTLAIIGTIAALTVPMLGQPKTKKPDQLKQKHGTFECYYDQEGILHSYYADSEDMPDGQDDQHLMTLGDGTSECQFTPPTKGVQNYAIYAIGAGGIGAYGLSYDATGYPYYEPAAVKVTGSISTGPDFQTDLQNACDPAGKNVPWLCTDWDKQWEKGAEKVKYTLVSPRGYAGKDAHAQDFLVDATSSSDCKKTCVFDTPVCEAMTECYITCDEYGGMGGYGGKYTVSVQLRSNDDVQYNIKSSTSNNKAAAYTELRFGSDKYISLGASEHGGDANCDNIWDGKEGKEGKGYDDPSYRDAAVKIVDKHNEGLGAEYEEEVTDETKRLDTWGFGYQAGSISLKTGNIPYEANAPGIRAWFGLAGGAGKTNFRVYEKLPTDATFYFKPGMNVMSDAGAITSTTDSIVEVEYDGANGIRQRLFTAENGTNGSAKASELLSITSNDRIFPSQYTMEDFTPKTPEFMPSHGVGYKSKLADVKNLYPGKSGAGAFPVLYQVNGIDGVYYKINDVVIGQEKIKKNTYPIDAEFVCPTDNEAPIFKSKRSEYYCGEKNTKGNWGAIIIKW